MTGIYNTIGVVLGMMLSITKTKRNLLELKANSSSQIINDCIEFHSKL